ncbi:hypothetical protein [Paenibacillus faecalis]|uniref:hypothetical protein n=1 Tax=Paenibacillus faecalis TaxID=2079532 RepID=UPI000D0E830D|nr:hypothetical protein [Paenibacillus faecalis]
MSHVNNKQRWNDIVELGLYVICGVSLVYFAITGVYAKCFQALLIIAVLLLLRGLIKITKSELPSALRFSVLMFIALTMMFANLFSMYGVIPYLDKIEHLLSGIILAFVGLYLFQRMLQHQDKQVQLPGKIAIWFSFWFAVAMAGVWEVYEFTVDHLLGFNSQNGSLKDTMLDIICGIVGAIIASLYLKVKMKREAADS